MSLLEGEIGRKNSWIEKDINLSFANWLQSKCHLKRFLANLEISKFSLLGKMTPGKVEARLNFKDSVWHNLIYDSKSAV